MIKANVPADVCSTAFLGEAGPIVRPYDADSADARIASDIDSPADSATIEPSRFHPVPPPDKRRRARRRRPYGHHPGNTGTQATTGAARRPALEEREV